MSVQSEKFELNRYIPKAEFVYKKTEELLASSVLLGEDIPSSVNSALNYVLKRTKQHSELTKSEVEANYAEMQFDVPQIGNRLTTVFKFVNKAHDTYHRCLLYTSPSPRDGLLSSMPSSA